MRRVIAFATKLSSASERVCVATTTDDRIREEQFS
jgi:hypothetical protein